ncbi:helicase MOV-10 [Coprinopsis sp. MPI-PUGE-AT-0042]|nr:helicase MOV-10 [Coprinopsis sp. MPI-PUGE-AT-0042]
MNPPPHTPIHSHSPQHHMAPYSHPHLYPSPAHMYPQPPPHAQRTHQQTRPQPPSGPGNPEAPLMSTSTIDTYWKSKLAPLPGFASDSNLVPTDNVSPQIITSAAVEEVRALFGKGPGGLPTMPVLGHSPSRSPRSLSPSKSPSRSPLLSPTALLSPSPTAPHLIPGPPSPSRAPSLKISPVPSPSISPTPSTSKEADGIAALSPISERDEDDNFGEQDMDISVEEEEEPPAEADKPPAVTSPSQDRNQFQGQETMPLDVYAPPFTPAYLLAIQHTLPHTLATIPPLLHFPSLSYLREYLTESRLREVYDGPSERGEGQGTGLASKLLLQPPNGEGGATQREGGAKLTPEVYTTHFTSLLSLELDALATMKSRLVLWKIGVTIDVWDEATFTLSCPNVRGDTDFGGKIAIGDIVILREVIEFKESGPTSEGDSVSSPTGTTTGKGKGTGRAFEARVTNVRRREGLVYISSPPLKTFIQTYTPPFPNTSFTGGWPVFTKDDPLPYLFNVSFLMDARGIVGMERGVQSIGRLLGVGSRDVDGVGRAGGDGAKDGDAERVNLANHWFFPTPSHLMTYPPFPVIPSTTPDTPFAKARDSGDWPGMKLSIREGEWFDLGLNLEQRRAVESVALYQSPVPHLISGPPGTGKTRTVVETVLQLLALHPHAHILLCAPSNPATDTLVLRLAKHLSPKDLLRLNDPNRSFAEVPDELKFFCYIDAATNQFGLPPWKALLAYRVVVTSCMDASILARARLTNVGMMEMEGELMDSLHPTRRGSEPVQPHWTHLLIDEAAQGSEPELCISTSVVLPSPEHVGRGTFVPQLVLCGDPNQLGPIVTSEVARGGELDVSLLERLFERELYAPARKALPFRLTTRSLSSGLVSPVSPTRASRGYSPYTNLVKNYRSHPVILMPPSAIFYNDTLEPCAKNNGVVQWAGLPVSHLPLKFVGCETLEASNDERATWYNKGEIRKVVDSIKSMLANNLLCTPPLRAGDIGVMAPWREQVWKLREELRKEKLSAVDVGTVEDFQGREKRVVFVSCVRSSQRFLPEDGRRGLGLIFERKRMNVAITRAKELLVVVGNANLLKSDPYWKSFLQFCLRNKLYAGPDVEIEEDGNYISRLESEMLGNIEGSTENELEKQGIYVAGEVAREVLREL